MIDDRDWQKIGYGTTRLRVPGGWFVMMFTGGPSKTVFYYPDPSHVWDGSALKDPEEEATKSSGLSIEKLIKTVAAATEKPATEVTEAPTPETVEAPKTE